MCWSFLAFAFEFEEFPDRPIYSERLAGAAISQSKPTVDFGQLLGKPAPPTTIRDVFLDDQQVIGKWFDGKYFQPVEFALRITPGLISRWLGFLQDREMWPSGELETRWNAVRRWSLGKQRFIVMLSAFPKLSLLELTEYVPSSNADIDGVRFVLQSGGENFRCNSTILRSQVAYDRLPAMSYDWWCDAPFSSWLKPEFETKSLAPYYPLGDYRCRWFLVEAPSVQGEYELFAISQNKRRSAKWIGR